MKRKLRLFPVCYGSPFTTTLLAIVVMGCLMLSGCKKDIADPVDTGQGDIEALSAKFKELDIKLVADNLVSPIGVIPVPDNSKRLFIIDQIGKIWIVDGY